MKGEVECSATNKNQYVMVELSNSLRKWQEELLE